MAFPAGSAYATSVKDRTVEFQNVLAKYATSAPKSTNVSQNRPTAAHAEFSRRAQAISHDLSQTTAKLDRLSQLARRKTLFDDRPVEISELTYIIKHDIAGLNRQLAELQPYSMARGSRPSRAGEHRAQRGRVRSSLSALSRLIMSLCLVHIHAWSVDVHGRCALHHRLHRGRKRTRSTPPVPCGRY